MLPKLLIKKYHDQYPIDLMVSNPVAKATVALVRK
ncbi:Protein of unknown function [Lactobacillus hominis DSM 23910 = CRBIP 24.179]|uniref:Uncharacterized protein n=1 Tax=Lactobacillus hominis DSM 23910 = CRBIP 24.179 TaxID=1423758 RepID=I7L669_9LACO|nr:Protein of unknown function [Lactobacillus hominis DSM 23910 = CRBIP 24.179]